MTMKPIYRLITAVLCAAFVVSGGRADDKQIQAQKQQRKVDYYYFEGLKDKQAGRHDVAYDHFRYCISLDSTAAAPLYELAVYALQLRKPELSLDYLRRAVKYDPTNYTYRLALASLSLNVGMYGEAAELYRELVHEHPAKPELIYYLAEALNQAGQTGEAIDRFNELENTLGVNEALSMQKYKLYMQMEQRDKAFNELQRLADNNPGDVRYPIMIGDLLLENGDTAGALSSYEAAHEIDPTSPYYPVSMANYYEAVGDRAAAENQIRTALVDRELDVETKMGILARYLRQLHQTPDAMMTADTLFRTLLAQHPEEPSLKRYYAGLLMMQNKTEEARYQYQLVTEMEPDNEEAWQQLLVIAIQANDTKEAMRICQKCRQMFPESPVYFFYLGVLYYEEKAYQKALDAYREGLEKIPEENVHMRSDFYGQIGDIYFQIKRRKEAFEAYDKSLQYNPNNTAVLNNYAYYLTILRPTGDLDKAEQMSARCIKLEPNNATYLDTYAWVFFKKQNYSLALIYIQNAVGKDTTNSAELLEHFGDILFMTGDKAKAVEQWKQARAAGKKSKTLERKIAEEAYLEGPEDESGDD